MLISDLSVNSIKMKCPYEKLCTVKFVKQKWYIMILKCSGLNG